jgi:N-glycosylase/DNA lyase
MEKQIAVLRKSAVGRLVSKRIKEFEALGRKGNRQWFSELCFCLLTANWKAKESIEIQNKLGEKGFICIPKSKLQRFLKKEGHRFHPQRAEYICLARKFLNIKDKLKGKDDFSAREWIVKNIKGLGYKEASHFLRNVGYKHLAILDRHILAVMSKEKYISMPKTLTRKRYLDIEKVFNQLAKQLKMSSAELDLYVWYIKTGKILK